MLGFWLASAAVFASVLGLPFTGIAFGSDIRLEIISGTSVTILEPDSVSGSSAAIIQRSDSPSFYGHGIFQVIIKDHEADSSSGEDINVRIEGKGETDNSLSISVPDTHEGSARFEFFMIHENSLLDLDALRPDNTDLATGMLGAGPRAAPVVTFGTGGDLDTGSALFDEVEFVIRYGELAYEVEYKNHDGEIRVDRDRYGSDNIVILSILDFDANLNPTSNDMFEVKEDNMILIFQTRGASFRDGVTFRETNVNSGVFEARLSLTRDIADEDPTEVADPQIDFLQWDSKSVIIHFMEKSNYDQDINDDSVVDITLDEPKINDGKSTFDASIEISDEDGRLEVAEPLSLSSELKLTLIDNDQNKDSEVEDELSDVIAVEVDGGLGADRAVFGLIENEDNSGVFEVDLRNNELQITFCSDDDSSCPDTSNSILELREQDFGKDIVVFYSDSHDNDSGQATFRSTIQLVTTPGQPSIKPIPQSANKVIVSIYDPDLNDNARTIDSYSFTLLGTEPAALVGASGKSIGSFAALEVLLDGSTPNYDGSRTFTFRETDTNTGNFTIEITSEQYQEIAHLDDPLGDQEIIELFYHDGMEDPDRKLSTEYQTAKRITPLGFSRSVVPIPATDIDRDGIIDPTTIVWRVIDPAFNHSPNIENTIPVRGVFFKIVLTSKAGDDSVLLDRVTNRLSEILEDPPTELRETGPNTSIFTAELSFRMGGQFDEIKDWDHAVLEITYIEESVFLDDDSNNSAKLTFSGNGAILSINQTRVKAGDILYVAVNDNDLNLDDTSVEEFRSSREAKGDYLLAIETENENICDKIVKCPAIETFRETGPSTGVFQAGFRIGTGIPVAGLDGQDIVQASRIVITYNDKIATGNDGTIEKVILVATGTGTIAVQPQLVGPATRLNVSIVDPDLNKNSLGSDRYDDTDFITISTDRKIGKASPDLIETSANSGEFYFTIDLVTDEVECGNNGKSEFEVQGGANPSAGVCPGDTLLIEYQDEQDAAGRKALSAASIPIESFDPILTTEKSAYGIEDKIVAIIYDPDANRNPDASDSLRGVRAFSIDDAAGIALVGRETGRNTGVFAISFSTSSQVKQSSVQVEAGNSVTVVYEDKFPAGFADNERDKKFSFEIPILASKSIIPAGLALSDTEGNVIDNLLAGKQVTVLAQLSSNSAQAQPYILVIEIRDANGITMFLGWQAVAFGSQSQIDVGLSWTPDLPDTYLVRTFAVSSMSNPEVLSEILEKQIKVQ